MGCVSTTNDHNLIKVATLNYSGILLSPYQFFASEAQNELIQKYSNVFAQIAEAHRPEFADQDKFKWDLGKLDQHWQQDRYTPIYNPTCGIKNNVYLVDEKEFIERWNDAYENKKRQLKELYLKPDKSKEKLSEEEKLQQLEKHLENCRLFDLICYKTLLRVIYNLNHIDTVDVSAKKYKEQQRKFFSKSFLKEDEKAKQIISFINKHKIDVLFLQETTDKLLQQVQFLTNDYRICKAGKKIDNELCKSVILIRELKFPGLRSLTEENNIFHRNYKRLLKKNTVQQILTADQLKDLNWNNDTVIQVVGNLILVCPHLSSKAENNQRQMKLMKQCLYKLKIWFPDYNIIIGGDLNGNFQMKGPSRDLNEEIVIDGEKKNIRQDPEIKAIIDHLQFQVYPNYQTGSTSNKKRTMMQAQRKKANKLSRGVKDYLVTDLQLVNCLVQTINDKQIFLNADIPLLPNEDHPYDHYLVVGEVRLENPVRHSYEANILKLYNPKKLTKQQVTELQEIGNS